MASIFISYRREDARADAGRLYDHLSARFGPDHVFMDIDDIAPGADFVEVLDRTLAGIDVLLVVIGRSWLAADMEGRRRIDAEGDFVRIEIERGLARDVRVIPVLVGGATMPGRTQLPRGIGALSQRHAIELSDSRFSDDVERLIAAIEAAAGAVRPRRRAWLAGFAALAVVAAAALWLGSLEPRVRLRAEPAVLDVGDYEEMLVRRGLFDARANAAGTGIGNRFEQTTADGAVVVVDRRTGLRWEKSGSGFWNRTGLREARQRIAGLNDARHGGHKDWRLPTLEEAMSLITPQSERGFHVAAAFDATAAPQMITSDTTPDGAIWIVYLQDGIAAPEAPDYNAWTRAVHGPD